jgi:hypothetical protein
MFFARRNAHPPTGCGALMKSPNLKLKVTRTLEIDGLVAALSELLADYKRLATDAEGNINPGCAEYIRKVQAISPGDLAEWTAFWENHVGAREEVIEKMRVIMLSPPNTADVDALCDHLDQHKFEIEQRMRLDRDGWANTVACAVELSNEEREKARALLFKVKEPLSELLADYQRLATDGGGQISPVRQQRIRKIGELLFTLRERNRFQKRSTSPDET